MGPATTMNGYPFTTGTGIVARIFWVEQILLTVDRVLEAVD